MKILFQNCQYKNDINFLLQESPLENIFKTQGTEAETSWIETLTVLHYKRHQQCFVIKDILSTMKEIISSFLFRQKASWRFIWHIDINRRSGKSWWKVSCACAQAFCPSSTIFFVQWNIIGRYLLWLGGSKLSSSLDDFYSASVIF